MDETALPLADPRTYCCPGERQPIERSVHLARLAAFFPPCGQCEHRAEDLRAAPQLARDWAEVDRRSALPPCFTAESLRGTQGRAFDTLRVAQLAQALAGSLWSAPRRATPPQVLIATDGDWSTAELGAAACRALHQSGCRAVEVGSATAPSLAALAGQARADAALWIGNATGTPHSLEIKLWTQFGQPASSPGDWDPIRALDLAACVRPRRTGGRLERADAAPAYLSRLSSAFHGLRPLVLVLDTRCEPLVRYFQQLAQHSACRLIRLGAAARGAKPGQRGPSENPPVPFVGERLKLIAQSIDEHRAHFGLWISGDGERLLAVDERGMAVAPESLFALLAASACRGQSGATLLWESGADDGAAILPARATGHSRPALEPLGATIVDAPGTRQAVCEQMQFSRALLGGGPGGRIWFSGEPPAADALSALSLLLATLSESDRPLSAVLDAVGPGVA